MTDVSTSWAEVIFRVTWRLEIQMKAAEGDFRSGCWNVRQHRQYFLRLISPARSNSIQERNSWVQSIVYPKTLDRTKLIGYWDMWLDEQEPLLGLSIGTGHDSSNIRKKYFDISLQCRKKTRKWAIYTCLEHARFPFLPRVECHQNIARCVSSRTHLLFADIRNHYNICLNPKLNWNWYCNCGFRQWCNSEMRWKFHA